MGWDIGNQKIEKYEDFNSICSELEGELSEIEGRLTFARFLRVNLGFTFRLMTRKVNLLPIQELILKGLFVSDNSLVVAGRGFSKSFLISVFSILYPLFNPGCKICLISANFRGSRRILEASEKMVTTKGAELLNACFPKNMRRAQDMYRWEMANGSEIFALPLSNGEGLRGTRATVACIDEGLLISKEIQDSILRPFLTNKINIDEETRIREVEDDLIAQGVITEKDRFSFPRNKYCVFSSASYEFEYLYTMFKDWVNSIYKPDLTEEKPPRYFVMRASYEVLPPNSILDMTQINAAKANGGETTDYFKREYKALFSNAGDSYFSYKKMHDCTIPNGQYPTVQVKGEKNAQYVLSIDPSYSASKSSDFFAMGVYMLVPDERKIILVHTYGRAGGDLKDHYAYLVYLLLHFNIVFAIIDDSGSEFIHGFNESALSAAKDLKLAFFDADLDNQDDYNQNLLKAKNQYNPLIGRILYGQKFLSAYIARMNQHLQNQIDSAKVWFGSSLSANEEAFNRARDFVPPIVLKDKYDNDYQVTDFIEELYSWNKETKSQAALIEVKITSLGHQTFDLPQNLRRETGAKRPRKDNYTCLLLAAQGAKYYYDMIFNATEPIPSTFTPVMIG